MNEFRKLEVIEKFHVLVDCLKESRWVRAYLKLKLGKDFKERHVEELATIMVDVHFNDIEVCEKTE